MKPAQLISCCLACGMSALAAPVYGQGAPIDAEPAAAAPAAPPTPRPAAPEPTPALPAASPGPSGGKMVLSAPPLASPVDRAGYHVHDGFYLRVGVGVAGNHFSVRADQGGGSDFKIGGPGLTLNLWVGGTPWRGVALGGMLGVQQVGGSDTVVNGRETNEDMSAGYVYLGPFIDAFPDPLRGLHVGGSLGLVALGANGSSNVLAKTYDVEDYNAAGIGASAWVGYMGFVGPEFSLGGMLQLTVLGTGEDKDDLVDRKGAGYSLGLSFTGLYH